MTTEIKRNGFKEGLPQEFEIVDLAELYERHKSTSTTTHRAEFYHIIWLKSGGPTTHLIDFNPLEIESNSILFLNKDIVHRVDDKAKFDGKAILFTDSFFCKTDSDSKFLRNCILFNDLFSVPQIKLEKSSKLFADLFHQMEVELINLKDNYQWDILKNQLHNLLLYSERESQKQNPIDVKKDADLDYVMLFKDLLESNYKTLKQVNYYAKQLTITEKRLNQATIKILGKPVKEIIDERIVLEAKRILAHSTESVKGIAYLLGFEEPTNFIKYFRKHVHSTPTEFREKISRA